MIARVRRDSFIQIISVPAKLPRCRDPNASSQVQNKTGWGNEQKNPVTYFATPKNADEGLTLGERKASVDDAGQTLT